MHEKRLYGIRGAVCTENTPEKLQKSVVDLITRILEKNNLCEEDIVCAQFTLTTDLDCLNPATALRKSGLCTDVPLFCGIEPPSQGSIGQTIRTLVTAYLNTKPFHVYIGGAEKLRPDLSTT